MSNPAWFQFLVSCNLDQREEIRANPSTALLEEDVIYQEATPYLCLLQAKEAS